MGKYTNRKRNMCKGMLWIFMFFFRISCRQRPPQFHIFKKRNFLQALTGRMLASSYPQRFHSWIRSDLITNLEQGNDGGGTWWSYWLKSGGPLPCRGKFSLAVLHRTFIMASKTILSTHWVVMLVTLGESSNPGLTFSYLEW